MLKLHRQGTAAEPLQGIVDLTAKNGSFAILFLKGEKGICDLEKNSGLSWNASLKRNCMDI